MNHVGFGNSYDQLFYLRRKIINATYICTIVTNMKFNPFSYQYLHAIIYACRNVRENAVLTQVDVRKMIAEWTHSVGWLTMLWV